MNIRTGGDETKTRLGRRQKADPISKIEQEGLVRVRVQVRVRGERQRHMEGRLGLSGCLAVWTDRFVARVGRPGR